jgi:hypothetical protein
MQSLPAQDFRSGRRIAQSIGLQLAICRIPVVPSRQFEASISGQASLRLSGQSGITSAKAGVALSHEHEPALRLLI